VLDEYRLVEDKVTSRHKFEFQSWIAANYAGRHRLARPVQCKCVLDGCGVGANFSQ